MYFMLILSYQREFIFVYSYSFSYFYFLDLISSLNDIFKILKYENSQKKKNCMVCSVCSVRYAIMEKSKPK